MLFRYRLFLEDGSETGEVQYAVMIQPGETISASDGRKFRVLDVLPTEENPSEYMGLLTVEAI
jgi:hypothetical protein